MTLLEQLQSEAIEFEQQIVNKVCTHDDLLAFDKHLGQKFGEVPELGDIVEALWSQFDNNHEAHVRHIEKRMFKDPVLA